MKQLSLLWLVIFVLTAVSCNSTDKSADSSISGDSNKTAKPVDSLADEETLTTIASEILTTLKTKDYPAFASYFHPTEGVTFSPYGFIDTKTAKNLSKASFLKLIEGRRPVIWGNYDGTGEIITLTAQQYLEKFVYNADYLHAEKIGHDQVIGQGNSLNNLAEIFPKQPFIEYHFSGFEQKYAGLDWTSLRLVFKQYQSNYYLVAVVHDQWTS